MTSTTDSSLKWENEFNDEMQLEIEKIDKGVLQTLDNQSYKQITSAIKLIINKPTWC